jgi:hypothetical protein
MRHRSHVQRAEIVLGNDIFTCYTLLGPLAKLATNLWYFRQSYAMIATKTGSKRPRAYAMVPRQTPHASDETWSRSPARTGRGHGDGAGVPRGTRVDSARHEGDRCDDAGEATRSPVWQGQQFPMTACRRGQGIVYPQPAVIDEISAEACLSVEAG